MRRALGKTPFLIAGGILFFAILICIVYLLSTDNYTDAEFRTMQDEISLSENVDLTGLREIQASGGPILNFSYLTKKFKHINKDILIVDTMIENHGYIYNTPVAFFGYHRAKPDLRYVIRRLVFTGTPFVDHKRVTSEAEVAKRYGFGYVHIQINSKALAPDASIDEFVLYFDKIPENVWVHFHCRHGKGRTSLALCMLDIMRNAPKVTLKDIVKRQHLLGSVDLFDTVVWKAKGTYSSKTLEQRKKFLEDFYAFICQRKAGGIQKWSDWRLKPQRDNTNFDEISMRASEFILKIN